MASLLLAGPQGLFSLLPLIFLFIFGFDFFLLLQLILVNHVNDAKK